MGAPGRFMFHALLDDGSVSLRFENAMLYRAQFALFSMRREPTTLCMSTRR